MTFGTLLPLFVFLGGYVAHVTLVGAPIGRMVHGFGIWLTTFGQDPPGKEKLDARHKDEEKKPFADRVRPYSPPGLLERRGRPVSFPVRVVWFVVVGWWLGIVWVVLSWSVFLAPYPFPDVVRAFLAELPCVMTLAYPEPRPGHGPAPAAGQ
jgi:hypothetical protein